MNTVATDEVPQTGVSDQVMMRNQLGCKTGAGTSRTPAVAATMGVVTMNALQRLIRSRMAELDISFRDIEQRGGIPWTTVSTLVNKTEHRQVPRRNTLEKLAKGLDLPLDLVRAAAADAAGYQLQEIPVTTLAEAEDVRIVAAAMANMTAEDRAKLRRLAVAFQNEIAAEQSEAKEQ
jgi:transcriptional regulator with XRE-family HTH domain